VWPRLEVEIDCSSGTFVRAIGRDLAEAVGTRAVMESLVRTAVGPFTLAASMPLAAIMPDSARAGLLPAAVAVAQLPRYVLAGEALAHAVRGALVQLPEPAADAVAAFGDAGELVGILRRLDSGWHRLRPNFHGVG
jgi:tRNA pseudouridine55 synthase